MAEHEKNAHLKNLDNDNNNNNQQQQQQQTPLKPKKKRKKQHDLEIKNIEEACSPAIYRVVKRINQPTEEDVVTRIRELGFECKGIVHHCCSSSSNEGKNDDENENTNKNKKGKYVATKTPFVDMLEHYLDNYNFTRDSMELIFTYSLSGKQRKDVHYVAEQRGLEHHSYGYKFRYITVANMSFLTPVDEPDTFYERFVIRNQSVYLEGPCIDEAGRKCEGQVSNNEKQARERRDGPHFHITLVHANDLIQLKQVKEEWKDVSMDDILVTILDKFAACAKDDWLDLGLGCVRVLNNGKCKGKGKGKEKEKEEEKEKQGQGVSTDESSTCKQADCKQEVEVDTYNSAYYRIIDWPSANTVRQEIGLPKTDFHVSIGFTHNDIHGVNKDYSTLFVPSTNKCTDTHTDASKQR